MKPVMFNPCWWDMLGFTHLSRTTLLEREEAKKAEKREKRDNQEENEGFFKLNVFVHYVFGKLKHNVWKQKGEEYRVSGKGGWSWLSRTRVFRTERYSRPSPVEVIELTDEEKEVTRTRSLIKMDQEMTKSPSERIFFPNIYTGSWDSKSTELKTKLKNNLKMLDSLLDRRLLQKEIEEREEKKELEKSKGKEKKNECYSFLCRTGPSSTQTCYSYSCLMSQKKEKELKEKQEAEEAEKKAAELAQEVGICNGRVYLRRIVRIDGSPQFLPKISLKPKGLSKGSLPPCHRFVTHRGQKKSILVLPDHDLKKLARSGSLREVFGFNYNGKLNHAIWPYHTTPRPVLRTSWLFRNQRIESIHAVALQLKTIWASIRWDDIQQKPPPSGANTITTENEVITTEILKRREVPPFGIRSEYLIRRIIVPIELPSYRSREKSTPIRSGLRERKRAESPVQRGPSMTESWHPEEELEIWELKQFTEKQKERERLAALRASNPRAF